MLIKIAPEFQINPDNDSSSLPSIASLADGGFIVTWDVVSQSRSGTDVYGQRYDANGTKVGKEFRINTRTKRNQSDTSVTSLKNSGFIITWTSFGQDGSEEGVYGQRYDANGTKVGKEFRINTYTIGSQNDSSVASLANGGFIVTWTSFGQNGGFPSTYNIYGQRYNANGTKAGQEFQVHSINDNQLNSSVVSLTDGRFVVIWESGLDFTSSIVYGQRYDADGNPIEQEFIIDSDNSGVFPSAASLLDGGFIVVWMSDDGLMSGIYGQRYDANGNLVGQEFLINTATNGFQGVPSVSSLADGGFIVTWRNGVQNTVSYDIYGQQYDANGNRVGQEFRINTPNNDFRRINPAVTSLSNGGYALAWQTEPLIGTDKDIYGAIFGTGEAGSIAFEQTSYSIREDGTPITTITLVRTDGSDGDVSVTLTPSNGTATANDYNNSPVIVSFAPRETSKTVTVPIINDGQIEADETLNLTLSNPTGTATLGSNINATLTIVDNDNNNLPKTPAIRVGLEFLLKSSNTVQSVRNLAVTSLDNGEFIIAFEIGYSGHSIGSGFGFTGQRYDANGNQVGEEFIINDTGRGVAIASLADGGFVATWLISLAINFNEPDNIRGQRYDANGNPIGQEFQVYDNPNSFNNLSYPSIASLADGGFVITWKDIFEDISSRRFDANGNPVGQKFQVNNNPISITNPSYPSTTSLADGGFVVTWTSEGQDGSDNGVAGQRYDANSNRVGSEFQVNTFTIGNQENSVVKSLTNGGFVVIWESEEQDGSFNGIYGQRYDANSNQVGQEFQVNTRTFGTQELPSVTSLDNGGFVVTWQSDGLYGQQYDAEGNPVGQEFQVNTHSFPANSAITSLNNNGFVVISKNFSNIYGQIFRPVNGLGVFELEKLARSGFVGELFFDPIDIGNLPLTSLYDETYYLSQNPDVANAVNSGILSNGYNHFVTFGQFEGRNPSTLYNEALYLAQNPDVANAVAQRIFSSGFQHYVSFGHQESRSPSDLFHEQAYRLQNPDVNDAITNGGLRSGFEHYLKYGKDEGRLPNNFLYNEAYYLSQNPDVAAAVTAGFFQDGFDHYIGFGQREKRNPSALFNENEYLTLNPDVADAVSANLLQSGFQHYISFGRAEGRQ